MAMHWHARAVSGDALRLERGGNDRRPDRARRHRINADAVFDQRFGQRTREADDRAFGGQVVEQRVVALVSSDRGRVDNAGALVHMRQRVLDHVEEAKHVGAERTLDLRRFDLPDILGLVLLGRIVHQNIDTTELLQRALSTPDLQNFSSPTSPEIRIASLPSRFTSSLVLLASLCSSRYMIAIFAPSRAMATAVRSRCLRP